MNKKALSIIMMLTLTITINGNVFAAPTTNASTTLKETQDNKKELQVKVQKLDKEVDEVLAKIDKSKKDMNKVAQDIKDTHAKLAVVENNSKAQEDLFRKRVRAMYISGTDGYVDIILTSENLSDFISRVDMVKKVIGFDKNIITKLKAERDSIVKQKENLNSANNKLAALKERNENTLSTLSKDIKEQKELLSKATEKEKALIASDNASKQLASANSTSSKGGTLSRGSSKSISYSKAMQMNATAYSGDGITASGTATNRDANGYSTIAVDPRVIPLGSTVYVEGYGYAVAEDTGGDIKGNRIDVFFPSESEAQNWGRRNVNVYIVNN